MKLLNAVVLISAVMVSCAGQPTKWEGKRTSLFPDGTYRHAVKVNLKKAKFDGRKEMRFSGIVDVRPQLIKVVGLTPFGTTLFRMNEDRKTGQLSFESEMEALKKAEPMIKRYYEPIRLLMTTPLPIPQNSGYRVVETDKEGWPLMIESRPNISRAGSGSTAGSSSVYVYKFSDYDLNHIPKKIRVENDEFDIEIGDEGYEI